MALISIDLPCYAGGRSLITLNFVCQRTGSNNDKAAFRCVRRDPWGNDFILPGSPQFVLTGSPDIRSWTFIDPNVPNTGTHTYRIQIQRIDGGGNFSEMVLTGTHFKR